MKNKIVSVIIPVYNTGQYLRECLTGIINQTLRDIEIICIDDGSTDDSLSIMREFASADDRIHIIRQENKGQAAARNAGIKKAAGSFIYFMDSDDILKENALEDLAGYAQREQTDVVFFDSEVVYENEEAYNNRRHITENYYIRTNNYSNVVKGYELFTAMMSNDEYRVSPCMQLISAEHIKKYKLRFYEDIFHEDDLFTYQCIMKAGRAVHISSAYYIRRVRSNSTMTGQTDFRKFYGYLIDYIGIQALTSKKDFPYDTRLQVNRFLEGIKNALTAMYNETKDIEAWFDKLSTKELNHAIHILGIKQSRQQIVKRILPAVILACIILFFSIYMVYMGTQNNEFNMDEMFSMMDIRGGGLGRPYEEENFFNTWHNAPEMESTIGVTLKNAFTGIFEAKNLYFRLLHIAYSFTPDEFTIWPSLILNIIFLNGSLIVIYMISRLLIDNKILASLPCIAWGFSSSAASLTLLIRFYCFKAFICLLLTYVLIISVRNGFGKARHFIGTAILMYIGFYTHQYFFVFAFFLSGIICLYMLINKQIKPLIKFAGMLMTGLVIFSIISNNYILSLFTSEGGRGEEALENLIRGGSGYFGRIQLYLKIISDAVFAGFDIYSVLLSIVILVLIYIIIRKTAPAELIKTNRTGNIKQNGILADQKAQYWIMLFFVCLLYLLLIARIAPYQHYRYVSCITPFITILFISLAANTFNAIGFKRTITAFTIVSTVCSFILVINLKNLNLYGGATTESIKKTNEEIAAYYHLPVVAIADGWDTAYFYWRIFEFEDEALFAEPDEINIDVINMKTFDSGFILIINDSIENKDDIIESLIDATDMKGSIYITNVVWHSVYLLA